MLIDSELPESNSSCGHDRTATYRFGAFVAPPMTLERYMASRKGKTGIGCACLWQHRLDYSTITHALYRCMRSDNALCFALSTSHL